MNSTETAAAEAVLEELIKATKLAPAPRATEWNEEEWVLYGKSISRLMDAGPGLAAVALSLARALRDTRSKLHHVAAYLDRTGGDEENDHGFAFALRQDARELDRLLADWDTMLGEIASGR